MNIYINLAVSDLKRSRSFYEALGFSINEQFSNDEALAVTVSENAGLMLLTREKFATFTPRTIVDAGKATEALLAIQLEDRAAVDTMFERAIARGGAAVREVEDHGFMYCHAFADPDGHIFEPFVMNMAAMPVGENA